MTIHPIFPSSKVFHRDSCSGEECVSVMPDSAALATVEGQPQSRDYATSHEQAF
jgi:hypothetical protein